MDLISQFQLHGKRALVCGASQGIGEACARVLAEAGAEVCLLARRLEPLNEIRRQLAGQGHQVINMDLGETEHIEERLKPFLPFHIVVHNAVGPKAGPLLQASSEDFLSGLQTHLLSAQKIAQLCLPAMSEARYGRFIQIISTSVKTPLPNLGVSNTVRGAMASWAKTLAMEVGARGITVNNILPGYTKTPRLESLRKASAERQKISESQIETQWLSSIPLGRFAEPQEIALAVAFLASPAAGYISGINLPVDGGRTPSL
jgi:3-oxoacyl-[acyl-carrier protein] reductase